jgi:hypothetical protein
MRFYQKAIGGNRGNQKEGRGKASTETKQHTHQASSVTFLGVAMGTMKVSTEINQCNTKGEKNKEF